MIKMTAGKFKGMQAVSDEKGVIRAAAMDQRGSLQKSIAKGAGIDASKVTVAQMEEFKATVSRILTPHSTAILLDPEFGLPAVAAKAPGTGVLLAYEKTGYDNAIAGRLPDLLEFESVLRLKAKGADCIKILLYYTPEDTAEVNDLKHAWVERIGSECQAEDIPFFLEFVGYDAFGGDEKGLEYAKKKPMIVKKSMEEFSKPQYKVDVLKVEVPINPAFIKGSKAWTGGDYAYTKEEVLAHFRDAASVSKVPFIYLSAGVTDEVFRENLEYAAESGTAFSGVLCGRATWADGVPIYGQKGLKALEEWLEDRGVKNILALNEVLNKGAKSWFDFYGGRDQIQVENQQPVA